MGGWWWLASEATIPGIFVCLWRSQVRLFLPSAEPVASIPRHLALEINVNGGTSDGHPLLSPAPPPAPCPLGRLPGAEAAVAAAEVRPRCGSMARPAALAAAAAAGSAPASSGASGGGCPLSGRFLDSARGGGGGGGCWEQRSAFPSDRRCAPRVLVPERAPGSRRSQGEVASAAGMRRLAHRLASAPQHPRLATREPCGALGRGTRFCRMHPP